MLKREFGVIATLAFGLALTFSAFGQKESQTPKPDPRPCTDDMQAMNERGDKVMGFDHLKTTHHFLLAADGGSILVEANDPNDQESRDQIRQHLHHISMMFSAGNFRAPMLIHAQNPPGTGAMKALKDRISYEFSENDRGGSIRIRTADPQALAAIHDFLRFQINEHRTGDPLDVTKPGK
jgi:hypothetical protein